MTIDERLEALTMNLELSSRETQDLRALVEAMAVANRERDRRTDQRFNAVAVMISELLHVAEIHEQRLGGLDDKLGEGE